MIYDNKLSSSGAKHRQTTKEEGSKEADRQEILMTSFLMSVFILNIFYLFFTSAPSCLSSSLLPSSFVVYLLTPEEDNHCRKRSCTIGSLCLVALVSTFPQQSCEPILSTSPAVVHSFRSARLAVHVCRPLSSFTGCDGGSNVIVAAAGESSQR